MDIVTVLNPECFLPSLVKLAQYRLRFRIRPECFRNIPIRWRIKLADILLRFLNVEEIGPSNLNDHQETS